ncbi:hypothetical protein MKX03_010673 [Papaver bracteatum]|nr:hypothetical protein MKX03_010673 [Papaver bracteatum]
MILTMADYDQERPELCKNILKTKDGIESLAFPLLEIIYPIYGQGELPQDFFRCAVVKGAQVSDPLSSK